MELWVSLFTAWSGTDGLERFLPTQRIVWFYDLNGAYRAIPALLCVVFPTVLPSQPKAQPYSPSDLQGIDSCSWHVLLLHGTRLGACLYKLYKPLIPSGLWLWMLLGDAGERPSTRRPWNIWVLEISACTSL